MRRLKSNTCTTSDFVEQHTDDSTDIAPPHAQNRKTAVGCVNALRNDGEKFRLFSNNVERPVELQQQYIVAVDRLVFGRGGKMRGYPTKAYAHGSELV